jgi:hypothetical protein
MLRILETPFVPLSSTIPKILHQKFSGTIPDALQSTVDNLAFQNPLWEHRLYNDEDAEKFVMDNYGHEIYKVYNMLSPQYGAARADLFRYMVVYKEGGVYLDLKSSFTRPIDEVLSGGESYVLAKWRNGAGEVHENWGVHGDYNFPGGEFQQWHIIAARGHPFLRAVISQVLQNIISYSSSRCGVGRIGVLKTTGPIAYTLAITPLTNKFRCTIIPNESYVFLKYSTLPSTLHTSLFKNHYTNNQSPVVRHLGIRGIADRAELALHNYHVGLRKNLRNWLKS